MIEVCSHAKRKSARTFILALFLLLGTATLFAIGFAPLLAEDTKKSTHEFYIPVIVQPNLPATKSENALSLVNQMRAEADIPPVRDSGHLNKNCFEHARYMAENNLLVHEQDPNLPFASASGQNCAQNANAWLGSNRVDSGWTVNDSIHGWMGSVAHRLWLLYPTTQTVGYGFFSTEDENRAAAAVDILSSANFEGDEKYTGWPVQYPKGKILVPSTRYPITLNWRYFGPQPQLKRTQIHTADGHHLAHDATTSLPAGHKGIQIIPKRDLPPNSHIIVTVKGNYEGKPFSHTWDFYTGE